MVRKPYFTAPDSLYIWFISLSLGSKKGFSIATIINLKLELLDHDHNNRTAKVKVSYRVTLSLVERYAVGLRFREKIQLRETASPEANDFLHEFSTSDFLTNSGGVVDRVRTVTLGEDVLDENGSLRPTDEVYAEAWITPVESIGEYALSNQMEYHFKQQI